MKKAFRKDTPLSKQRAIRNHYARRISPGRHGFDIADWQDASSQRLRFEVLAANVALEGKSLLDVGCGVGDLWGFFVEKNVLVDYTGVDIVASVVEEARRRHPDVRFECRDLFAVEPLERERYDVVFCSGTFNLDLGNNRAFLADALPRLLRLARESLVVNFLHRRSKRQHQHCVYYDPDEVAAVLEPWGFDVRILDDYLPNDFTVICTKTDTATGSPATKKC